MKQRILFLLHVPPPIHGAAVMGKYITDSALIQSQFDCCFVNIGVAGNLQDIGKGGVKKYVKTLKLLWVIIEKVLTFKPDLVYVTPTASGKPFYKDYLIVQLLKIFKRNIVVHLHNRGVSRMKRKTGTMMYRRFFNGIKVIILSDLLYPDIQRYVNRKDVFICHNGIPDFSNSKSFHHNNTIPHLLFLSNLLISKGIFVLLDSLKTLKDKGVPFICDIVGSETSEVNGQQLCDEISKRQIASYVEYRGEKYGSEKNELLTNADVFVFPTYYDYETFGIVLIEAMQNSLPVIATDVGGIPEIVKDGVNGLIVKPHDSTALSDAIELLIKDANKRERFGIAGRKIFEEKFTMSIFENNLIRILHFCLRNME